MQTYVLYSLTFTSYFLIIKGGYGSIHYQNKKTGATIGMAEPFLVIEKLCH